MYPTAVFKLSKSDVSLKNNFFDIQFFEIDVIPRYLSRLKQFWLQVQYFAKSQAEAFLYLMILFDVKLKSYWKSIKSLKKYLKSLVKLSQCIWNRQFVWVLGLFSCVVYSKIIILRISPNSVHMRENVDQNNSEYGQFLRSVSTLMNENKT